MLRVLSHSPTINAIDIVRNPKIVITFNEGIVPTSVDYTRLSLNEASTFSVIPTDVTVLYNASGVSNGIQVQPIGNLDANKKYKMFLYGYPNSVLSKNNNKQLDETYSFEFTTGITVDPTITNPSGVIINTDVDIDSDITLNTEAITFYVTSTSPKNTTPNLDLTTSGIIINFNYDISIDSITASGYISVEEHNVLR